MASAPNAAAGLQEPGKDWLPTILYKLGRVGEADTYRGEWAQSYFNAIESLRYRGLPVYSVDDVKGLKGIGPKITTKIEQITKTGTFPAYEKAITEFDLDGLAELRKVHGIGPKKAMELWNKGIHSLAQLRAAPAAVSALTDSQKLGLKYVEDATQRIPRAEMMQHERYLLTALDPRFQALIVGSYRRKAADSGDIDVLLTLPDAMHVKEQTALFKQNIALLSDPDIHYIVDILMQGDKKMSGYVQLSLKDKVRRIDFLRVSQSEFPYALFYFTGSDLFNVAVRKHAEELGYTMNESTMKPIREGVPPVPPMTTEEEIFRFLGLEYVAPEARRGRQDIRLIGQAAAGAAAGKKRGGARKEPGADLSPESHKV